MIVATAGHVDHGKTSLVRQLTGVETDRLEEEKRRGLTINLGYAYLPVKRDELPDTQIGFIDVPGHSRFINTMISGISGIDLGLLVVAANDGLMPQTIEHVQVMRLLGVKNYAVVLTHIDTVEPATLNSVSQAATALLAQEEKQQEVPVFPVDNLSGAGIAALKGYLESLARARTSSTPSGYFRMSIDRSFLLKGAGLVVTGTALSGQVSTDNNLMLLPKQTTLRVRSIHANNETAGSASAGQRCALNIVGDVSKEQLQRGDWLVDPAAGPATRRVDARVHLLASAPFGLKHLSPVKLYIGAARLSARLALLEKGGGNTKLKPGEQQLVQLILERDISCCHADRFLLRDDSESVLLGGGEVLDPWGPRTGKYKPNRLAQLAALEQRSLADTLRILLLEQQQIVNLTQLAMARNLSEEKCHAAVSSSNYFEKLSLWQSKGINYCATSEQFSTAEKGLLQALKDWHRGHPQDKGMPAKLGAEAMAENHKLLLMPVTSGLISQGKIKLANGLLAMAGHRVTMDAADAPAWRRIEAVLVKHDKNIPTVGDLATQLRQPAKALLSTLRSAASAGRVYQVSDRRFALPALMKSFANAAAELGQSNAEFSVIQYRDHLGIGRNQAVELLEYFDRMKFTRRNDNQRVVVDVDFPDRYVS